jgi:hypothetical protein
MHSFFFLWLCFVFVVAALVELAYFLKRKSRRQTHHGAGKSFASRLEFRVYAVG